MNNYKRAKEYIDYILAHPCWGIVQIEWDAIDEIKELLDKETPMKPIVKTRCGNCESNKILEYLTDDYGDLDYILYYKYCGDCGQRVDWSENND